MDISTPSNHNRNSEGDRQKLVSDHGSAFGTNIFDADKLSSSNYLSFLRSPSTSAGINMDKFETDTPPKSPSSGQPSQKKKCPLEQGVLNFPWLGDIEKLIHKQLGSLTEVRDKTILNAMDCLIR